MPFVPRSAIEFLPEFKRRIELWGEDCGVGITLTDEALLRAAHKLNALNAASVSANPTLDEIVEAWRTNFAIVADELYELEFPNRVTN